MVSFLSPRPKETPGKSQSNLMYGNLKEIPFLSHLKSKEADTSLPIQAVGIGAFTPINGIVRVGSGFTPAPNHFSFLSLSLVCLILAKQNLNQLEI